MSNGDVNGDGSLDVSDAVYLLVHLFRGGDPPAACEDRPEFVARVAELEAALSTCRTELGAARENAQALSSQVEGLETELARCRSRLGLPDTGQSGCYGFDDVMGSWTEIPCGQAVCQGQDGAYSSGCSSLDRFVDNGDGTVTDHCTGLMWQQNTPDLNGDGTSNDSDYSPSWCDALAYSENLTFAGHDDWRLPNVRELQSIVDYGRFYPSIDPKLTTLQLGYWSSTSFEGDFSAAWTVFLSDAGGRTTLVYKDSNDPTVRAVRNTP